MRPLPDFITYSLCGFCRGALPKLSAMPPNLSTVWLRLAVPDQLLREIEEAKPLRQPAHPAGDRDKTARNSRAILDQDGSPWAMASCEYFAADASCQKLQNVLVDYFVFIVYNV
jgi:hypothetical protein